MLPPIETGTLPLSFVEAHIFLACFVAELWIVG